MGGLSKKSINIKLKIKRQRNSKLRTLRKLYKKATVAERTAIAGKVRKLAPYLAADAYLREE